MNAIRCLNNMSTSKRKYRTQEQYVLELYTLNPNLEVIDSFVNTVTKLLHRCRVCGYEWAITPHELFRTNRARCPECSKKSAAESREKQNYVIGQTLADAGRDITITRTRRGKKKNGKKIWEYQYTCNRCSFDCGEHFKDGVEIAEYWTTQDNLNQGKGCACCSRRRIVPEINSIAASAECAWMGRYFKDQNDARKYPPSYSKKVLLTCPDCGRDKFIAPHTLLNSGFGCICGDGISYPEKFMYNILEQLDVNFDYHKAFEWSKNAVNGTKYYDFYIPDKNLIIETHGPQHHKRAFGETIQTARTIEQERSNDQFKKDLALKNGIVSYIEIDCTKSDNNFIFNSILGSGLLDILNKKQSSVDICAADIFASSNLIKLCSELWNAGASIEDIAVRLKLHKDTIRKYMYKADSFGWSKYKKIS